jgi:hypothetical protein
MAIIANATEPGSSRVGEKKAPAVAESNATNSTKAHGTTAFTSASLISFLCLDVIFDFIIL